MHAPSRCTHADYVVVWEEELGGEQDAESTEQSRRNERFRARFETSLVREGLELERVRPACPHLLQHTFKQLVRSLHGTPGHLRATLNTCNGAKHCVASPL